MSLVIGFGSTEQKQRENLYIKLKDIVYNAVKEYPEKSLGLERCISADAISEIEKKVGELSTKLEKKYDIFFFGNSKPRFYPFRHRLKELLQKNEDLKSLKILVWEGIRNYFKFDSRKSNDQLSKVMNQSWLTICTKSKCNMLLGKYFETSMSGSVICGDISEDGEHTWKDNMIYIDDSMSDAEIIKEIKDALLDKEKLVVKTEKMKKRMEKYYLSNFTSNLMGMFE